MASDPQPFGRIRTPKFGALSLCVWLWPLQALAQSGEQVERYLEFNVCAAAAMAGLFYAGLGVWIGRAAKHRVAAALGQVAIAIAIRAVAWPRSGANTFLWLALLATLSSAGFAWTLHVAARRGALWMFLVAGWWLVPLVAWFPGLFVIGPFLSW